jgi:uncharacterized protein (TIGR02246 family)
MRAQILAAACLTLALGTPAFAQQAPTCDGPRDACQQIVNLGKQYESAYNNKDAAGVSATFTSDAIVVWEGPTLSGRDAIEKVLGDFIKAGFTNHSGPADQMHVVGDMAWVIGTWSESGPSPNNSTQTYRGRWAAVDVNQGGTWKTRMLISNTIETPPE